MSFALNFTCFFCESSSEGDGACGSFPHVSGIIGVNHDLDNVACYNCDSGGSNERIAVGPLSFAVYVGGEVVNNVCPVGAVDGNGESTVSSCGPSVEIAVGSCAYGCLVFTENEVCRIFHCACGVGKVDGVILCFCSIVNESDYYRRCKEASCFVIGSFATVDAYEHAAESACNVESAVSSNVYSYRSFSVSFVPYEFGVERILFAFAGNGRLSLFGSSGLSLFGSGGLSYFGSSGLSLFGSGGLSLFGSGGLSLFGSGGLSHFRSGGLSLFGSGGLSCLGSGGLGCFGSCRLGYFGSCFLRSNKQVTRSSREHHNHGKNQGQNAQYVLVSHIENLHLKFGALLHGNIIA